MVVVISMRFVRIGRILVISVIFGDGAIVQINMLDDGGRKEAYGR